MSSKLRIRIGEVEIDYEGTEEFLKQELPELLKTAMELHKAAGTASTSSRPNNGGKGVEEKAGIVPSLTTNSIAGKLQAKSGPDLLRAAAVHLALVKKMGSFNRKQLLAEMKSATPYYRTAYGSNLSKNIKSCVMGNQITEIGTDAYALTAAARTELEGKLADG